MVQKIWVGAAILALIIVGVLYYVGSSTANSWNFGDDKSPVMYFYQDDCPHCIAMKPALEDLGNKGYRVKLMDAQTNPDYWATYNITGTPTWVAANGDRLESEQSETTLQAWFDAHGAKIA